MPRSSAVRIVLMASAGSLPPHIHPPIAHVPSATRELTNAVPGIIVSSIGLVPLGVPRLSVRAPLHAGQRRAPPPRQIRVPDVATPAASEGAASRAHWHDGVPCARIAPAAVTMPVSTRSGAVGSPG